MQMPLDKGFEGKLVFEVLSPDAKDFERPIQHIDLHPQIIVFEQMPFDPYQRIYELTNSPKHFIVVAYIHAGDLSWSTH